MAIASVTKASGDTVGASERNALREDILRHAGDILTDTGVANAYIVTCDNQITALSAGQAVKVLVANANTQVGATLRFKNSLALDNTSAIKCIDGTDPRPDEIPAGSVLTLVYTGTVWTIQSINSARFRDLVKNLKSTTYVQEKIITTGDTGGSATDYNVTHYQGEISMNNSSAEDLVYVAFESGRNEDTNAAIGPVAGATQAFSVTGSFRLDRAYANYDMGFFGYKANIDAPGATDVTHHAGFIMNGSTLYASVGNGSTQSKVAISFPNINEYSVYKVEFDGTDWKFYIDDMTTPVATRTSSKPTMANLLYYLFAIDSNNGNTRAAWIKKSLIVESKLHLS